MMINYCFLQLFPITGRKRVFDASFFSTRQGIHQGLNVPMGKQIKHLYCNPITGQPGFEYLAWGNLRWAKMRNTFRFASLINTLKRRSNIRAVTVHHKPDFATILDHWHHMLRGTCRFIHRWLCPVFWWQANYYSAIFYCFRIAPVCCTSWFLGVIPQRFI